MILSSLGHWQRYATNSSLEAGFRFLLRPDLHELPDGVHPIQDDQLFAVIWRGLGRGKEDSPLEYHRRYLDIQYVLSGFDLIGWQKIEECRRPSGNFDPEKDLGFFADHPKFWMPVAGGEFAIFYPEDAHAPLGGSGPIHKVIIKAQVD